VKEHVLRRARPVGVNHRLAIKLIHPVNSVAVGDGLGLLPRGADPAYGRREGPLAGDEFDFDNAVCGADVGNVDVWLHDDSVGIVPRPLPVNGSVLVDDGSLALAPGACGDGGDLAVEAVTSDTILSWEVDPGCHDSMSNVITRDGLQHVVFHVIGGGRASAEVHQGPERLQHRLQSRAGHYVGTGIFEGFRGDVGHIEAKVIRESNEEAEAWVVDEEGASVRAGSEHGQTDVESTGDLFLVGPLPVTRTSRDVDGQVTQVPGLGEKSECHFGRFGGILLRFGAGQEAKLGHGMVRGEDKNTAQHGPPPWGNGGQVGVHDLERREEEGVDFIERLMLVEFCVDLATYEGQLCGDEFVAVVGSLALPVFPLGVVGTDSGEKVLAGKPTVVDGRSPLIWPKVDAPIEYIPVLVDLGRCDAIFDQNSIFVYGETNLHWHAEKMRRHGILVGHVPTRMVPVTEVDDPKVGQHV
jgi:hypothetical protein